MSKLEYSINSTAFHISTILLTYFVCFGAYALVSVPFWDDWLLTLHTSDTLWELFSQLGRQEQYFLMAPFSVYGSPVLWSIASFVCWGVVPVCGYLILRGLGWSPASSFWVAILTAAAPLNQARFALAVIPYSLSAMFFALALLLLVQSVTRKSVAARVLAAVFLLISFTTNSFLTLAVLPIAVVFLALRQSQPDLELRSALLGTLKHLELLILPILYWWSKYFQVPYGHYSDYNTFQVGLLEAVEQSFIALARLFYYIPVFFPTTSHILEALLISAIFLGCAWIAARKLRATIEIQEAVSSMKWVQVIVVVVLLVLALFPYAIVGLRPSYNGLWETRHLTTLAIVAGLAIFLILQLLVPKLWFSSALMAVLFGFMAMNISASRQLLADIQDSYAMIYSPEIQNIPDNSLVAVFEENRSYRMMKRSFRFYALSTMFSEVSQKRTVMAGIASSFATEQGDASVDPADSETPYAMAEFCAKFVALPEYGFGDISAPNSFVEVYLRPQSEPPSFFVGLANALGFLFNKEDTIAAAVANLDVTVEVRDVPDLNCGQEAS